MNMYTLLAHPIYVASLIILILNDIYFKYVWPSAITGKLSDVTGVFCFLIFLFVACTPMVGQKKAMRFAGAIIAFIFAAIQIPMVVELTNALLASLGLPVTNLTPDPTDLFVLLLIPLFALFPKRAIVNPSKKPELRKVSTSITMIVSMFWFVATSFVSQQLIMVNKEYTIGESAAYTLAKIDMYLTDNDFTIRERIATNDSTYTYEFITEEIVYVDSAYTFPRTINWKAEFLLVEKRQYLALNKISLTSRNFKIRPEIADSLVLTKFLIPFEQYAIQNNLFSK